MVGRACPYSSWSESRKIEIYDGSRLTRQVGVTYETPARTPAEIEGRRRRSAYWIALKQKYERASARPWLHVEPDPPESK